MAKRAKPNFWNPEEVELIPHFISKSEYDHSIKVMAEIFYHHVILEKNEKSLNQKAEENQDDTGNPKK